jgi:peptidoglycan/xylan/chitin deacetylase (PgdA/CDA1 family)
MGGAVGLAALASFTTACGADVSASSLQPSALTPPTGGTATAAAVDDDLIRRRYGIKPFAPAPPPPAVKPITLSASDPTVFSSVPMTDKVVFITIDDGAEKEPGFIQLVKDFQVPITVELANLFIRDDYAYFEKLYQTGLVSIQNHTVDHPLNMPALSPAQQLDQIAGQQEILRKQYGVTPYVFRPPGGNYDEATVTATAQAGLKGVMLWKESMQISDMQYQTSVHALHPGDIILAHFRGPAQLDGESMVRMVTRMFRHIQDQGFTIGNLEHYV